MKYPERFITFCTNLQLKLTALRKEILYILWQAEQPLKAYEILDRLLKTKLNSKPITIYRTLNFFVTHQLVHKIESIQSYTLCCEPNKHLFSAVLLVCEACHSAFEVHETILQTLVSKLALDNDFKLHQDVIEIKGSCKRCHS